MVRLGAICIICIMFFPFGPVVALGQSSLDESALPTVWNRKVSILPRGEAVVGGFDVVSYFTQNEAVKGSKEHQVAYDNGLFYFSSAENAQIFSEAPSDYIPQFGGYCAWAVSNNYTARIDPDAFSIVDGKLYLNFSKRVRNRWNEQRDENILRGEGYWPGLNAGLQ